MVKKLFIPVLIGSLLMSVPGFAPDSVKARLSFLGVCCVGLLVAVLYERQAATIVDGFEKLLDAIGDFIDERNNSLRLWISAVMFSGSLYAKKRSASPLVRWTSSRLRSSWSRSTLPTTRKDIH